MTQIAGVLVLVLPLSGSGRDSAVGSWHSARGSFANLFSK